MINQAGEAEARVAEWYEEWDAEREWVRGPPPKPKRPGDFQQRFYRVPLGPTKPLKDGQAPLGVPILPETRPKGSHPDLPWWYKGWGILPDWVRQHAERESAVPLCYQGHRLQRCTFDARKMSKQCKAGCGHCPKPGEAVLACRSKKCLGGGEGYMVCRRRSCMRRPRFSPLACDPLFHGPRSPALLEPLLGPAGGTANARGTVIVVPGGNYEVRRSPPPHGPVGGVAVGGVAMPDVRVRRAAVPRATRGGARRRLAGGAAGSNHVASALAVRTAADLPAWTS